MRSLKQQRRMAAKARRRQRKLDRANARAAAFNAGRRWGMTNQVALWSLRELLDAACADIDSQLRQAYMDSLVYGEGVMSTAQVLLEQGKATWWPRP